MAADTTRIPHVQLFSRHCTDLQRFKLSARLATPRPEITPTHPQHPAHRAWNLHLAVPQIHDAHLTSCYATTQGPTRCPVISLLCCLWYYYVCQIASDSRIPGHPNRPNPEGPKPLCCLLPVTVRAAQSDFSSSPALRRQCHRLCQAGSEDVRALRDGGSVSSRAFGFRALGVLVLDTLEDFRRAFRPQVDVL